VQCKGERVLTQKVEPLLAQVGVSIDLPNQQLILTYPAMEKLTVSLTPELEHQTDGSFCTGKENKIL
jgi:MOSC N-terminal beta barrel domain